MMDGRLLDRFVAARDDAAFEALVERHAPMVQAVCSRSLGNRHDIEDAFQATFLILARRAGSIRRGDSIGPWLKQVAARVALRARADAARRRTLPISDPGPAETPAAEAPGRDDILALHEELRRLPDRYRVPLVLCYFEGKTNEQAAGELRCPVGTVKGRIWKAREILRGRLRRRGLTGSDGRG